MSAARRLRLSGIAYGGDYNPEQWPEEVWAEDVRLMREAGRQHGQRRHLLLGAAGTAPRASYDFALARPRPRPAARERHRASTWPPRPRPRPPGSSRRTRRRCRSTEDGRRLSYGSRQTFCPQQPRLPRARPLRDRRARWPSATPTTRPSSCGTSTTSTAATIRRCYCDTSAAAFRDWLRDRYDATWTRSTTPGARRSGASATATGTQIMPPRADRRGPATRPSSWTGAASAPTRCCRCARPSATCCAGPPRTSRSPPTSWSLRNFDALDYWRWAPELDVVSNDHYLHVRRTPSRDRHRAQRRPDAVAGRRPRGC